MLGRAAFVDVLSEIASLTSDYSINSDHLFVIKDPLFKAPFGRATGR